MEISFSRLFEVPALQMLLNSVGDGLVVADADQRIQYMNPQAEKILRVALSKAKGQEIHKCHTCPWKVDEVLNGSTPDTPYRAELSVKDRWVSVTASPLFSGRGHREGSVMIVADTTEKHEIQAVVARQNEELKKRQDSLDQQIEFAREIQRALFPEEDRRIHGWQSRFWNRQSLIVGGDFAFSLADAEGGWIVLGDIMGKGVFASQFVPLMHNFLIEETASLPSPGLLLEAINRRLIHFVQERFTLFATMMVGRLRKGDHTLVFSSAGHPNPVLLRRAGLESPTFPEQFPIGLQADSTYKDTPLPMGAGDQLLLYTDGVIEAKDRQNAGKNPWFLDFFRREWTFGQDSFALLRGQLETLSGKGPLTDDQTVIGLSLADEDCP